MKSPRLPRIVLLVLLSLALVICVAGWQHFRFGTVSATPQIEKLRVESVTTLHAEGHGGATINLRNAQTIPTEYIGRTELLSELQSNGARPLALAAGDFDGDGVDDLISSYSTESGGLLTLHRGNVDSIFPNSPEAQERKQRGEFVDAPFLPQAKIIITSGKPEFLSVGDFNNDGKQDVVTAGRVGNALLFFKGDGQGNFQQEEKISLQGEVTALIAGDLNRKDSLKDLAVSIAGNDGAKVLIFEGWDGALKNAEVEIINLSQAANALAIVSLNKDGFGDLAIAAGNELLIAEGRDRQLTLHKERRSETISAISRRIFNANIVTLTNGSFTDNSITEILALTEDGSLHSIKSFESRLQAVSSQNQPTKAGTQNKLLVTRLNIDDLLQAKQIIRGRISSGSSTDDLILLDQTNHQIHVLSKSRSIESKNTPSNSPRLRVSASFNGDEAIAALPMRLNKDGLNDIVFLSKNQIVPSVAMTAPQAVFTVNSTLNNADATPGNGVCEIAPPGSGVCTLRAAIQEANATVAADEISFNIPGSNPTIAPTSTSVLPQVTRTVTIDATTQPGFSGAPIVELNGTSSNSHGFNVFQAHNSIFRGFIINRFADSGILLFDTNDAKIEGNYIGTDRTGTAAQGNGGTGSLLDSAVVVTGSNSIVGGRTAAARNVISGNSFHGIQIFGGRVEGNFIGTDKNGAAALSNCVVVSDPSGCNNVLVGSTGGGNHTLNVAIGAAAVNGGNVISGNRGNGLFIGGSTNGSSNITVENNFIGTNADATADLGNSNNGILVNRLETENLRIGSNALDGFNVISGNDRHGILITEVDGGSIENNFIGVGIGVGAGLILNNRHAIALTELTSDIRIGGSGVTPGECNAPCNVIAFASDFQGVHINQFNPNPFAPNAVPNRVGNSILSNNFIFPTTAQLLVDLVGNTGRTFNDPMDFDQGVNNLQNFADITQVTPSGGGLNVQGNLNSTPNSQFDIDFYIAKSGSEGMQATFVSNIRVITDANGNAPFNHAITGQTQSGDKVFTITTSVNDKNSSESSPLILIHQQGCSYTVAPLVINIGVAGGPIEVNVTTDSGCLWTAVSNSPFITFEGYNNEGGVIGVGNGSGQFRVAFNNGPARTGTMTIAGQTVTVNQASGQACTFNVSPTNFDVSVSGQNVTVNVTTQAGCNWVAVSNAPFITGSGGGTGSGSVTFTVSANDTPNPRFGTMTVAMQVVTVNQPPLPPSCSFVVSPLSVNSGATGGNVTINVTTQAGCNWTAASNVAFITGGGNFTGSGSATFTVAQNQGPARSGTLTVAGQTVTVNQESGCSFFVAPNAVNISPAGGPITIIILAPDGCNWTAASNAPFISGGGSGSGNGAATFDVQENVGMARTGTLTVAGQTVTVTQGTSQSCSFQVQPLSFEVGVAGGNATVNVTTQDGCFWRGLSNSDFIDGSGSNIGSGSVTFTVEANTLNPRTGTMTVAGQTVTVNQLGTCTFFVTPLGFNLTTTGGEINVTVQTQDGCNWSFASNSSFITGGGNRTSAGTATFNVASNTNGPPRNGTVTVAEQTIPVNQDGQQSCSFIVNPLSVNVSSFGGSRTINVSTQAGCNWTAISNSSFITGGGNGTGSGSVTFNVAANNGNARQGTLTVANQTVTVNQESGCSFLVTPQSFTISGASQTVTVNVRTFPVQECSWSGASNSAFITGGGNGTGDGSVTFNVAANPDASRQGTMTVAGETVTVNQGINQTCSFVVQPVLFNVSGEAGSVTVNVTTQDGCFWSGTSNSSHTTGGGNRIGNGSVTFAYSSNPGLNEITATMTVAGQIVTLRQAPLCPVTVNPTSFNVVAAGGNLTVSVTTPNGCLWSSSSNASFITVSGNGNGNGTASLTVGGNIGPNQRVGTVQVADQTINITQTGCAYTLNPSSLTFPASGGVKSFVLTTTATTCQWEAGMSPAGLGFVAPASGTGGDTLSIALTSNTTIAQRTATITMTGGGSVVVTQLTKNNVFDFDGDNKVDFSKAGEDEDDFAHLPEGINMLNWVINNSSDGSQRIAAFGQTGDKLVPGDYNGDSKSDLAVFRPSDATWYIARPTGVPAQNFDAIQFGISTDIPVPSDYDGDGHTDIAVFRPSDGTWWIRRSTDGGVTSQQWGVNGDKPVPGDYDADGKTDIAVWRPSDGVWYIIKSSDNSFQFVQWGLSGDKPVMGDYDGDFKTDIAVFRPSEGNWFILRSSNNSFLGLNWGIATDVLVPADYDGDLKTDIAVWRPSEGNWYILRSSDGSVEIRQLGQSGDVPVPSALLPQ